MNTYESGETWVVKVGSSLLSSEGAGIDRALIDALVAQIARLKKLGKRVVLVSSGAVAVGAKRLGIAGRPSSLHELQAAAAVGQMGLIVALVMLVVSYLIVTLTALSISVN